MGFVAEADSSVPASRESSPAGDHVAPWPMSQPPYQTFACWVLFDQAAI
jgi:hypothetical protein